MNEQLNPFKRGDLLMSITGKQLWLSMVETSGICKCSVLEAGRAVDIWYGSLSQIARWDESRAKSLRKITREITDTEQKLRELHAQRDIIFNAAKEKK